VLAAWVMRRFRKRRMQVASLHGLSPMSRASTRDCEILVGGLQQLPWLAYRLQHFIGVSEHEHELSDTAMAARTAVARRQESEAIARGVSPGAATSTQGVDSPPSTAPAWSPWGATPWGPRGPRPIRRLQVSFASADMHHVAMYRDMVDRFTEGWETVELQRPGIRDTAWVDAWKRGLDASSGCVIIFSSSYVSRVASSTRDAPLLVEARYILRRVQRDRSFKLFVLNPELTGQDYANLKFYLDQDDSGMNRELWIDFLRNRRSALSVSRLAMRGRGQPHGRIAASDSSTASTAPSTGGAVQAEEGRGDARREDTCNEAAVAVASSLATTSLATTATASTP